MVLAPLRVQWSKVIWYSPQSQNAERVPVTRPKSRSWYSIIHPAAPSPRRQSMQGKRHGRAGPIRILPPDSSAGVRPRSSLRPSQRSPPTSQPRACMSKSWTGSLPSQSRGRVALNRNRPSREPDSSKNHSTPPKPVNIRCIHAQKEMWTMRPCRRISIRQFTSQKVPRKGILRQQISDRHSPQRTKGRISRI